MTAANNSIMFNDMPPFEQTPIETVELQFTAMEIEHNLNLQLKPFLKKFTRTIVFSCLFIASLGIVLYAYPCYATISAGTILFILILYYILTTRNFRKTNRKNAQKAESSKDVYEIFDTCFRVYIYENQELKTIRYITYTEIDDFNEDESYFVFVKNNILYTLRKNDPACAVLIEKIRNNAACNGSKQMNKEIKSQFLTLLFVFLSLFSVLIPLLMHKHMSDAYFISLPIQIEYLFLPIPIITMLVGFVFRKKIRIRTVNFSCVLCIILLMLCAFAYGYEPESILTEENALAEEILQESENILGIDLPDNYTVTYAYEYETENRRAADFQLDQKTAEKLSETLRSSDKWMDYAPSILDGIKPFYSTGDYMLLYNMDTKQYNELPEQNGTYKFIYIDFSAEHGVLYVTWYESDFIAYTE